METSLIERATWRDYYELCKPNVVWLMILTAIVGMCMATPGVVPVDVVIFASVGIALCAGSAAAINHLADQHVDAVMARVLAQQGAGFGDDSPIWAEVEAAVL